MRDHGDAPGRCDHCVLGRTSAGGFRPPGWQPCRPSANRRANSLWGCFLTFLRHQEGCCLGSPAVVILPEMMRSPGWLWAGVWPTHGLTFFEEVKLVGSLTADRQVRTATAPSSGIDMNRRQAASSWVSWRSGPANFCRSATRAGSVAASGIRLPAASSRIRWSNRLRDLVPTFRPKFRSRPCKGISSVMKPCCRVSRAMSVAVISGAETDLR